MNTFLASPKALAGYTAHTYNRAQRAFQCCPFYLNLFRAMAQASVPLPTIAGAGGVEQGFCGQALTENRVERELMWLIQVGLLRREVDGQGITDSFRLTPLAKQILAQYPGEQRQFPSPSLLDRLQNRLARWLAPLATLLVRG
ncbi:sll0871 [Synechocystis sp. PCC 6803]|jgi:hypothetical protein|uniref:Sll0871 protein n=1 Tax=Synechocystis sp. (strain ATCC 27184 / PCC 6803 / Kazusa) TaxID=1111708 RepID=P73568_SYNY3|nr:MULTISPECIES: Npun_F0494 family protein [unclassified Synechocystis]WLT36899.1 hypothetical protein NON20_12440 [Synechocystis sp. B12]BAM51350.1 hypothetical protein BEST7613_2419 [Synechocystis sp. PCC 6803] [Bacillus subtilis BEST7613]AGF51297.1 hypothetical protein MYO_110430 [Synechocystis sp. PCC 6803]ALJ67310.1 hypothetical protein AOY38_05340 [Synechocystis sp. PCC 6803]AVP89153.1 hypothetical protein C7I86_05355 [Synechocystis sp. IPPAS B-1465]